MARRYIVTNPRQGQSMTVASTDDKVNISQEVVYDVQVVDDATADYFVANANKVDVITASGLPITNLSVYYFDGKIIPFLICRKKTARQDRKNAALWSVTCSYDSGDVQNGKEGDFKAVSPPNALTDITPREEPFVDVIEEVMYKDKKDKSVLTPTGNFYAEPVMEEVPILTIKLTQYESSIAYQTMLDRTAKVNETTYRTKGRYMWKIEKVEAVEVEVQLAGGLTTAAMVTYTLRLSTKTNGWKEERLLIDTHFYLSSGGTLVLDGDGNKKKVAFTDVQSFGHTTGFIDSDGKYKAGATPDAEYFESMDAIEFKSSSSGFLQV